MKKTKLIEKSQNKLPMDVKKILFMSAFSAMVLTACGRTVTTDPVTPTPSQTIETTVEPTVDPATDSTVEPTTDVSGNATVTEPEEKTFADATFVQTGEHEYTISIDCPDNSAEILDPASVPFYEISLEGCSGNHGISSELINAIFTYGLQVNPSNPTQVNVENYIDNPMLVNIHYTGNKYVVFTNDASQYPDDYYVFHAAELNGNQYGSPNSVQANMCAIVLKESIIKCNSNLSCALGAYIAGDNWDIAMQECKDATGLTDEEIYKYYDAGFVASYAQQGLVDVDFINGVFRYINSPITISYYDESGYTVSSDTYSLERVKT